MNKFLKIFFVSLSAFGLLAAGFIPTSAFAAEKVIKDTKDTKDTKAAKVKTTKVAKVDINHASEQELEALPGIGKTYAKKIIEGRPYKKKSDLVKIGVPKKTVDNLKGLIKFGKVEKDKHHKKKESHKKKEKKSLSASKASETDVEAKPEKEKKSFSKRAETNVETKSAKESFKVQPRKGMVWVNTDSMIYHKEGDQWYGKTEKGEYMTEEAAIKSGARLSKHE